MKEKKELGEIGRREERREGRVKRRIIKGIVMVLVMMVMGCNSGGGKDPEKLFLSEMVNLGRGFLDVFVSFGDMIAGTLGIKADTKKSEISAYFSKIENTMKTVKEKLGEIVGEYGNYPKVKENVEEFIGKIGKIEVGAKEAALGASGEDKIGGATSAGQAAVAADKNSVISLVKGIKAIVEIVLRDGEGSADATKTVDGDKKDIGKLFANEDANRAQEAEAAKASASIGAVSGADILKAIAKAKEDPQAYNTDGIEKATDAAEIAIAVNSKKEIKDESAKKDAVIAGGIALRAMAKDGKFAAKQDASDKYANAVNGVVASAVSKVLSTLTIAIRNRVDEGLKEINKVLGEIKQGEGSVAKINE
ncbi:variable large family protein [Borrelia crocidurae]|uniref:Variable large protein n=1 Tax=Borrelia crocidurae (strain Achema) TaxID=1155096 RepID=I0FDU8_BORCA|nr:variable large family protein [Borrelia crocidurae]AFI31654.1 Vlp protein, delta subfamily [Borrelia crocidurae str. Achema]